jgi:hypothetical protein
MASTRSSRHDVFQTISTTSLYSWPTYESTPLYDRSSLRALAEDVRTLARVWFRREAHDSVDGVICHLPLEHVEFEPHDSYTGRTRYEMGQLFRAFLLKELHGWAHETALIEYLQQ